MLIKGNDVIGLKVMTMDTGKHIEDVSDLIYDPQEHKVTAFLLKPAGMFKDAKVVGFADIKRIGKDAVMVESEAVMRKAGDISERVASIAKDDTYLTKTKIMTEDGTELGKVSDLLFDEFTGDVMELEVSQGLKNLESGKKRVKVADIITIGEDATIVKAYTEAEMEAQGESQGLRGAIQTGKQKAGEVYDAAKQKQAEVTTPENKQKMRDDFEATKMKMKTTMQNAMGTIKAKVDEVKSSEQTQSVVDKAKQTVQQTTESVKQRAQQTQTSLEEKRVEGAVGKYLTTNVIDLESDAVVGVRGEIVTGEMIERAREYGVLDRVVSNVSEAPVN
jgi:uncharacterized protein YrrD